jgi:hypothetical protein
MPTIKRFDRCRIEMYFGDHPPPHFHVIAVNAKAVFRIDTLELWAGEMDGRDSIEALRWARENRAVLAAKWQEFSEEEL